MSRLLKGKERFFRCRHPSLLSLGLHNQLNSLASSTQKNFKHAVSQKYGACVYFDELINWQSDLAFFGPTLWHFMEI
jgi:hypothetical protein